MLLYRSKILTLSFLWLSTIFSQSYKDVPYLQDRSIQFVKQKNDIRLIGVKTDGNKNINVLSSKGLLSPWDKKLKPNFQYRPILNHNIITIESHKNQFYYLTNKAVLSNSFGGKFYKEHRIENPISFSMGNDSSFLIVNDKKLFFFDKKGRINDSHSIAEKPLLVKFHAETNNFLILTRTAGLRQSAA